MRFPKERLTVTVDRDLVEEAEQAVRDGSADSVSGYVNAALAEYSAKQRRLAALAEAIRAYEAEFGEITDAEVEEQARVDRANAVVVRGKAGVLKKGKPRTAAS
jgi:Arc/MetJ-type ribon-helix-helix transcriptional regulator